MEKEILKFASDGTHPYLQAIRRLLHSLSVDNRMHLGSVLTLELSSSPDPALENKQIEVCDCFAEFEGVAEPVAISVIAREGKLASLVLVASPGITIPEKPNVLRLYYGAMDAEGIWFERKTRNLEQAVIEI